ncbi:DICT sensory domain-containing protein [Halopelagius fulvigenes]|uniref:DICT sensory domain-containing protein n=1 Tax=Halopelagius fulvigenes TaxID=1198324 RepID=A0ABD5U490_9EURY
MTLQFVIEEAEKRRKSAVYYAPEEGDLPAQFDAQNVEMEYRDVPPGGPDPFVTIFDGGRFLGAVSVESLRTFLWPPIRRPYDATDLSPEYRALVELLDDTVFASLSRRQLLATTREFEDRAWRTGRGRLHVGFQSRSAFRAQRSLYRRMAAETDLDVHVYRAGDDGTDDDASDDGVAESGLTLHVGSEAEFGRHWFVVFDGGGNDGPKNALVAEQRTDETFYGVWTYDSGLVDRALAELA